MFYVDKEFMEFRTLPFYCDFYQKLMMSFID